MMQIAINIIYENSKDSDQCMHLGIRKFSFRRYIPMILLSNSEGPDLGILLFSYDIIVLSYVKFAIYESARENVPSDICVQRRLKSACASAQSDQRLHCPHEETLHSWRPLGTQCAQSDQSLRYPHEDTLHSWRPLGT